MAGDFRARPDVPKKQKASPNGLAFFGRVSQQS